jgi:hypothetical protein
VKVTIDTRHDSLEHALAAVRSAYGVPDDPDDAGDGAFRPSPRRRNTAAMNPTSNIAPRGESDKIRAWARDQGLEVKDSGRMPAAVIRAYEAARVG